MTDKNYAAQASMKCQEPLFIQFLADATDVPVVNDDFANKALYAICGISSKRQLNTEPLAQENWFKVLGWFDKWSAGEGKSINGGRNPPFRMGEVAFCRNSPISKNPFDKKYAPDPYDNPHDLWARGWQCAMWRDQHGRKK